MSQANVELARRYVETFNRVGLDGTEHWRHPEIEMFDPPDFPDAERYVGEAALRSALGSYLDFGWDGQFHVQEYLDAGEEVVIIWQVRGRTPHGGGLPLEQTLAHVWLFEGEKLRRIRQYRTKAEGLEAAGLSE